MALETLDLWTLVRKRPQIDPGDLATAVREEVCRQGLDYRSRLLVRDSVEALRLCWGEARARQWLEQCPERKRIEAICQEDFDKIGYPSLRVRVKEKTTPDQIRECLWDLSRTIFNRTELTVGGTAALILAEVVNRQTATIHIVDDVTPALRSICGRRCELSSACVLTFERLPSHYYLRGWMNRTHMLGRFGRLHCRFVDAHDIFVSKLFSANHDGFVELLELQDTLDVNLLEVKVKRDCSDLTAAPRLKKIATDNWKILFGEPLPQ